MGKVVDLGEHRRDSEQREYLLNLLHCCFDLGLTSPDGVEKCVHVMYKRSNLNGNKPPKITSIKNKH